MIISRTTISAMMDKRLIRRSSIKDHIDSFKVYFDASLELAGRIDDQKYIECLTDQLGHYNENYTLYFKPSELAPVALEIKEGLDLFGLAKLAHVCRDHIQIGYFEDLIKNISFDDLTEPEEYIDEFRRYYQLWIELARSYNTNKPLVLIEEVLEEE